ncbi:hypothetical protein ADICYQ_1367 [Cyclobacterium qasimii M12-11B]|uniref:Uncharacterized protein n=2 Tax=Cyclobacterium qasimii TaxID=1350429 RepID=S7VJ95_9BACT|nr:hypothetical protein ADICYQ_1367 [Cyclobacterium qasimii M12-11B]GEO21423.1 hypothetical protein CQA01_19570 [Cyclobacterium qasimii]
MILSITPKNYKNYENKITLPSKNGIEKRIVWTDNSVPSYVYVNGN